MLPHIEVSALAKKYQIGKRQKYLTLRDSLMSFYKTNDESRDFWALRDVNFTVQPAEVVGIIGPNGAGKSTLLKILSRITYPTCGQVILRGKVSSLLEVGTGFNQELTGRENIFLNGAILGMRQKEIKKKFDEIVDFSGVEKFLDTPVKHYSSGMYVHLAFAVAAHLDSEIMIIDEVLAIGDAEFQKKSLGKMRSVSQSGRTVLFVSHNIGTIAQLCNRCLQFNGGKLVADSYDVGSVINSYLKSASNPAAVNEWLVDPRGTCKTQRVIRAAITDKTGDNTLSVITNNTDAYITIDLEIKRLDKMLSLGYALYLESGALLYWSYPVSLGDKSGHWRLMSQIPQILNEGCYQLGVIAMLGPRQWILQPGRGNPTISFTVQDSLGKPIFGAYKRQGIFTPPIEWHLSKL